MGFFPEKGEQKAEAAPPVQNKKDPDSLKPESLPLALISALFSF